MANDLTGQTFGRLVVIAKAPPLKKRTRWICRCECGVQKEINAYSLIAGQTKSCGCLALEKRRSKPHDEAYSRGNKHKPDLWRQPAIRKKKDKKDKSAERKIRIDSKTEIYTSSPLDDETVRANFIAKRDSYAQKIYGE